MSMLNFYINRAGKNLPKTRKRILERRQGVNCAMSLAANENRPSAPQTRVNFSLGQRQAVVFLSSWCS